MPVERVGCRPFIGWAGSMITCAASISRITGLALRNDFLWVSVLKVTIRWIAGHLALPLNKQANPWA